MLQKYNLKWDDFQPNIAKSFSSLRNDNRFADVTLMSDDYQIMPAHKVVLSACSEYFSKVLSQNNCSNFMLCLDGISKEDLTNVVDYIYHGQVKIEQANLDRFLQIAQKLKLQGLLVDETVTIREKEEIPSNHDTTVDKKQVPDDAITKATQLIEKEVRRKKHKKTHDLLIPASSDGLQVEEFKSMLDNNISSVNGMFKCKFCDYESNNKSHTKDHVEIHLDLTFSCQVCGKAVKTRMSLRKHFAVKHSNLK